MMLQVKNCKLLAVSLGLFALAISFSGCKDKNVPVNPYVTPGNTENPGWVINVENDMTASMTAVVEVSFAQTEGILAAFMGDKCCGIAEYKADYGLYWLYLSPATEEGGDVQLRFYSPELKRIYDATETFPFRNDTQLGSVATPYKPEWNVAE